MATKRQVSDVFLFAVWWFESLGIEQDASTSSFKSILARASRLKREGYDLERVKRTILTMKTRNIEVQTPYAVKWRSPVQGQTWYEYSTPMIPVWDNIGNRLASENALPLRVS